MACPSEDAISRFVAGDIVEPARAELVEHLATCAECRTLVSEMARDLPVEAAAISPTGTRLGYPQLEVPPANQGAIFRPEDRVGERYRIVRFIAEGGMGEVYEAEDLELHRRVALKTVRQEISAHPRVLDRFKREINIAHKVSHPNVCRIFDIGFHISGGERIAFLTMEFLDGETLAERLKRVGRMSTAEALPLVTQMVLGLSAAHREGVVHRDFKSPNVMLVSRGNDVRVVVTDFGLARGAVADSLASTATDQRGLIGSPAYMAPEQVAGLDVSATADQYALGVVMFEMVTGAWPFVDQTAVLTALKRLQEPAPSPRNFIPDLDPRWETAILRCLAREPENRFENIEDVVRSLAVSDSTAPQLRAHTSAVRRWAPWGVAALLAGVVLIRTLTKPAPQPESQIAVAPSSPPIERVAPAPPMAKITIHTDPSDAELFIDDAKVDNPFTTEIPRSNRAHVIRATAPGFTVETRGVAFDQNHELSVTLAKLSPPPSARPSRQKKTRSKDLDHFILRYPQ